MPFVPVINLQQHGIVCVLLRWDMVRWTEEFCLSVQVELDDRATYVKLLARLQMLDRVGEAGWAQVAALEGALGRAVAAQSGPHVPPAGAA